MPPAIVMLLFLTGEAPTGPVLQDLRAKRPGDLRDLAHTWAALEQAKRETPSAVVVVEAEDEVMRARRLSLELTRRALEQRRGVESPGNLELRDQMKRNGGQPWEVGR